MPAPVEEDAAPAPPARSRAARVLDWFERVGNRFPDPIVLSLASPRLLTPLVAAAALASHVMADGAIIIVVPLAGAQFYVAGRHPLAGILAGFAPMAGAMFANFLPYALDPIVAGFSEMGAQIIAPAYRVNPLRNYWLAIATAVVVVPATWWLVDGVVEPRLRGVAVDGDPALMPTAAPLTSRERRGLWIAAASALALASGFTPIVAPSLSPMRAPDGSLTGSGSPILQALIPLVLAFCRRYVTGFGVGTLMSLLLPFGVVYLALQVAMLLAWWGLGLPLGIGGR